jgi:hypothetical protein
MTNVCELKDHVEEKGLSSSWPPKLGPIHGTFSAHEGKRSTMNMAPLSKDCLSLQNNPKSTKPITRNETKRKI